MYLSEKQRKIVDFAISNNNEVTKKDAMSLINTHYHNGDKHVGECLSRMVKSGILIRIKPGNFKLGSRIKPTLEIKNQQKLF